MTTAPPTPQDRLEAAAENHANVSETIELIGHVGWSRNPEAYDSFICGAHYEATEGETRRLLERAMEIIQNLDPYADGSPLLADYERLVKENK